jgi:hypothetical protein
VKEYLLPQPPVQEIVVELTPTLNKNFMKAVAIKSTESSNGGYVTTIALQAKDPFGGTISTKRLVKTEQPIAEGTEVELNLRDYVEESYTWADADGVERKSTWLKAKLV